MEYLRLLDNNLKFKAYPDINERIKFILNRPQVREVITNINKRHLNGYYYHNYKFIFICNNIKVERWMLDDNLYRENGKPAIVKYENNQVVEEQWLLNGILYRGNDKPAIVKYENNQIIEEQWWFNNRPYRSNNKPEVIKYNNGRVIEEKRWLSCCECNNKFCNTNEYTITKYNNDKVVNVLHYRNNIKI